MSRLFWAFGVNIVCACLAGSALAPLCTHFISIDNGGNTSMIRIKRDDLIARWMEFDYAGNSFPAIIWPNKFPISVERLHIYCCKRSAKRELSIHSIFSPKFTFSPGKPLFLHFIQLLTAEQSSNCTELKNDSRWQWIERVSVQCQSIEPIVDVRKLFQSSLHLFAAWFDKDEKRLFSPQINCNRLQI